MKGCDMKEILYSVKDVQGQEWRLVIIYDGPVPEDALGICDGDYFHLLSWNGYQNAIGVPY